MAADNLDGPEVDLLIKELASPARKKPAANTPAVPVVPVQRAARSFWGGTNRLILPPTPRKKWFAGFTFPTMPSMPAMPSIRMPSMRMPSLRIPLMRVPSTAVPSVRMSSVVMHPQAVIVARMCVGLGVSLGIAMPFWPYPRTGLWWMMFYLFAVGMVLVSGVWSAKLTWATRLGYAHIVALGVVLWGVTLVTEETMRNGYFSAQASGLW